jgi:hypothetical protein
MRGVIGKIFLFGNSHYEPRIRPALVCPPQDTMVDKTDKTDKHPPERQDSLQNNVGLFHIGPRLTIDPAHLQVNPNVVDEHHFKVNTHQYGSGEASGGASTWDAIEVSKPQDSEPVKRTSSEESSRHRAYHGVVPGSASINNILGNEANKLTSNAPERGKPRSNDPKDPASRVDHHTPSTKEKFVGKVKVLFGKATGDQDALSEGEALGKGNVEKGGR